MGLLSSRRPILPAPTESLVESADETGLATDLDTDLSRRTEKTYKTIPDDGSPITISTVGNKKSGKLTKTSQQSQTSLLIEYFESEKRAEGGKRRPSLRVRYTPSHSRKNKERGEGHILVTESPTTRRPSVSHRIPLGGNDTLADHSVEGSISSLESAEDFRPPIDIEVLHHEDSDRSVLSPPLENRSFVPESDISSMPAESSLGPNINVDMAPSHSISIGGRGTSSENTSLKPPVMPAERNLSNERITQKVIEKLSNKPRVSSSSKRQHSSHSGSRSSTSREVGSSTDPRIRVTKTIDDDSFPSATGSSLISGSHLSADPRSMDQRSVRSGNSNTSITNNPKLLQTVEDAIRRLILPELNELRKDQKSHRSRHDKYSNPSDISSSSVSREERTRRKSSGSKSRRRVSKDSESGLPSEARKHRSHRTADYDSQSESYEPSESHDSIREEKRKHRHSSSIRRARDAVAGAAAGAALTAAALKSHDSGSSLEYSEHRRRRRSKSRSSRSVSVAEKDDTFHKHKVPPMPFVSDLGTDLTRSSLKSSTDGRSATPTRREVQGVIRGSSGELSSPTSQTTPTGNSHDLKKGLGLHHGNFSEHNLSSHDLSSRREATEGPNQDEPRHSDEMDFSKHGFAALTDPDRARQYERNLHQQHPIRRGLSPIQSVASYATTEANRNSLMQPRSIESFHSPGKHPRVNEQASVSSLSSAHSANLASSSRPKGMSLESRSEIMHQHADSVESTPRQMDPDAIFEEQHLENESYRDSPYIDKVTAGQHVTARGKGDTAGYVEPPMGVESAVASLVDASLVSADYGQSSRHSQADSYGARELVSPPLSHRSYASGQSDSPLKQQTSQHSGTAHGGLHRSMPLLSSPQQSPARSFSHEQDEPSVKSVRLSPVATKNVPGGQSERSPESDITTNPSIIRGPIGGLAQGNTEHWPYDPTPPHSRANLVLPPVSRDISTAGADLIPEPLSTNRDHDLDGKRDMYMASQPMSTPLGGKDEGYETGANVPSPGLYSHGRETREDTFTPEAGLDDVSLGDDPFHNPRGQYVSGLSQGLSPLYDNTTGHGRDNIHSKDIVALMDHLTMRDAQRNARDTEILVTLVRSAAEMRNSFEDMRKFIADQGDNIMDTADRQHEKTQKAIGGPRPQPNAPARVAMSTASEEDQSSKRRNVFQRALRGLGAKNTVELQNIEGMLMRLLDEVEGLRALQPAGAQQGPPRSTSLTSAENARAATDTGYEPEGQAGTSSTGNRSGYFSNNSSRQADYRNHGNLRESGNRVSTVMEGDEEYDDYGDLGPATPGNVQAASRTPLTTPPRNSQTSHGRGSSVPLRTPPRLHEENVGSHSHENTPQMSTGNHSGKKHKSFASSFIPKMVSRWSKTTTSSDNYRASQQRVRTYSEHSQSGSDLGDYDYEHDPHGDDRIRSNASLPRDPYDDEENRPPSPLIPSQVSDNPKYQAHRNSVNLQHPQPRQGPTGRFQSRLETEAQLYNNDQISPTSQNSSQWEAHSGLVPPQQPTSRGGHLSPISDAGYSAEQGFQDNRSIRTSSSQGPPRPPKIPNDDPLVPQRPPKVIMSPQSSNRQPTYVDHVAAARAGSPAFDKSPVSALRSPQSAGRKPSGPRPLAPSSGSKGDFGGIKRTRFRGSPNQIDSDDDTTAVY